jgi:phage terminase large subunit
MPAVQQKIRLDIPTPAWALPLLVSKRYKGAKGGRGGGKSHFFAELLVEEHLCNPDQQSVCIREVQSTLDTSVKKLIEEKIDALKINDFFDIQVNKIKDRRGKGLIIFKGMQDYNASNIKSLEGFDRAWVEEAQNLSVRSLQLLRPTMRKEGSEIWFSWNPENEADPVDRFFQTPRPDAICVTVNIDDNPFRSDLLWAEMLADRENLDVGEFNHIWRGGYRVISKEQIFAAKCRVQEFEPEPFWDGPYYGADWGFGKDPTAAVEAWISEKTLYIFCESYEHGLELDDIACRWINDIPGIEKHTVRSDSARPDTISHVKSPGRLNDRPCIPYLVGAEKGKGSVEDGIEFIRGFKAIIIHPRCTNMWAEAINYKWKTNRAGDILPVPVDADNHLWDSLRYALEPLTKKQRNISDKLFALYG